MAEAVKDLDMAKRVDREQGNDAGVTTGPNGEVIVDEVPF
jgi:hypothetical protein